MSQQDEFFTPDQIDEQIDQRARNGSSRPSDPQFLAEMQQVARRLHAEQNPALQRTWERLQARAGGQSAPVHQDVSVPYTSWHSERNRAMYIPDQRLQPPAKNRAGRRFLVASLSTLVAALLVASLFVFLSFARGGGGSPNPGPGGTGPGSTPSSTSGTPNVAATATSAVASTLHFSCAVPVPTRGQGSMPQVASWSVNGKIAVLNGALGLFDGATCKRLPLSQLPANFTAQTLSWSPDGAHLLADSTILNGTTGAPETRIVLVPENTRSPLLSSFSGGGIIILTSAWSPDGTRIVSAFGLSGAMVAELNVWDAATGKYLVTLDQRQLPHLLSSSLVWSADGRTISAVSGTSVYVWDSHSGKLVHTYAHVFNNYQAEISPDGQYIATAIAPSQVKIAPSDPTVRVYRLATGKLLGSFTVNQTGEISTLAWAPDSHALAIGNATGVVTVWDAATGLVSHTAPDVGTTEIMRSIAWSSDSKHFVTLGALINNQSHVMGYIWTI